jgi:hypothetical protein
MPLMCRDQSLPEPQGGKMKKFLCFVACLFLLACGSDTEQSKSDTESAEKDQQIEGMVVELATRNVSCGCALEKVGHCGNYIEIESQYVEIANGEQLGLGAMEWCGKEGVKAESAGEVNNGKFVAATLVIK